jgi:hypothetical protein
MGKTPIVVNNCPGFLVNRILFPYFFGFQALLSDGADFGNPGFVRLNFGTTATQLDAALERMDTLLKG